MTRRMHTLALLLCPLVSGTAVSAQTDTNLPSPPEIKWSCLDSNVQVSMDVLPQARDCTIRVHKQIGSTEVSIVPMVARSAREAGLGRDVYYYVGPDMAAVPMARQLFTSFHVWCGYGELPQFEWNESTLDLDDGRTLYSITNHPFSVSNPENAKHINYFLVFPELGNFATNITLTLPYSLHGTATVFRCHFRRENNSSQPAGGAYVLPGAGKTSAHP